MPLASLIGTHGYWLLGLGCLLEGESMLVLAGFAAHLGYLDPLLVILVAAGAGFTGDQALFWLGRRHGRVMLARFPSLVRRAARVRDLLSRHQVAAIIGVRFAYGLRIGGPVLMGTLPIAGWRFTLFNGLGALLWATAVGAIGWTFGQAVEVVLGDLRHLEVELLLALAVAIGIVWLLRRARAARE